MAPHFVSLPLEVKNNIFEHYLGTFDYPVIHLTKIPESRPLGFVYHYRAILKSQASWTTPQSLALLTTCKQLYDEIISFVYCHLPILVDGSDLAPSERVDWLTARLPAAHIASVRYLVVDCRQGLSDTASTPLALHQHRSLYSSFSALRQVTVLSQLSLIRALREGHDIDVRRLQYDSMYLFKFIDEKETQNTTKELFRKGWLRYQGNGLKNGSGKTINFEMRAEVGRFAAFRDRPSPHQWPPHNQLCGNILTVTALTDDNGGFDVSLERCPGFEQVRKLMEDDSMWDWFHLDFRYM